MLHVNETVDARKMQNVILLWEIDCLKEKTTREDHWWNFSPSCPNLLKSSSSLTVKSTITVTKLWSYGILSISSSDSFFQQTLSDSPQESAVVSCSCFCESWRISECPSWLTASFSAVLASCSLPPCFSSPLPSVPACLSVLSEVLSEVVLRLHTDYHYQDEIQFGNKI